MCWQSEDYKDGTTERLINNNKTLPSPLRSSAGSRRACRKRDSRGERESSQEREREREKQEAEWRIEREREREKRVVRA